MQSCLQQTTNINWNELMEVARKVNQFLGSQVVIHSTGLAKLASAHLFQRWKPQTPSGSRSIRMDLVQMGAETCLVVEYLETT